MVVDAEVNETNKTTHRSERGSVLARKNKGDKKLKKTEKKDLTGPTLLEMSLNTENRRNLRCLNIPKLSRIPIKRYTNGTLSRGC